MREQGAQFADQIMEDLACPQCEYNLRGLHAAKIHCPECGFPCDVPRMVANRWTRPWWDAPGFNQLVTPLSWLVLTGCFLFIFSIFESQGFRSPPVVTIFLALLAMVIWLGLLAAAARRFGDERGASLSLLLHALFVGYLVGVMGVVGFMIAGFQSNSRAWFCLCFLLSCAMAALLYYCRKGERYVAEQCLKRYLQTLAG